MSVSASVASRVKQMYSEEEEEDQKVFAMAPVIIQRPRIVSLSEEDLIKIAPLDQITVRHHLIFAIIYRLLSSRI